MRAIQTLVFATLLTFAFSHFVAADAGVGVTPGKIQVDDPLKPGGRYTLPHVGVINTGTETQRYEVVMSHLDDDGLRWPSQKWLDLEPRSFELKPGETQIVGLRVSLPSSAEPGDYSALVEAQMIGDAGASLQASVATKLAFTVGESTWLEAKRRQINNFLDDIEPWSYLAAGVLLAGIALKVSGRWIKFRSPIQYR